MKRLNLLLVGLMAITLFACNSTEEETEKPVKETNEKAKLSEKKDNTKEEKYVQNKDFKVLPQADMKNIPENWYSGEIKSLINWEDKNGHNTFIVSIVNKEIKGTSDSPEGLTREIHGYHYKSTEGGPELIREIKDFETDCIFDNRLAYDPTYLSITDLDNDHYGEICFLYSLGCTSELSPDNVKLMFIENGDKFAIRGSTTVYYGKEAFGGEQKIDGTLKSGPKEFLNHTKGVWAKYMEKHNYKDNGGN